VTIFNARMATYNKKRAAVLAFSRNRFDYVPRLVYLIEEVPEGRNAPLPFTWRFLNETQERRYPIITIVAARGVTIELEGFAPGFPEPGTPALDIYRIQDAALLPRLATDFSGTYLCGTIEVAENPVTLDVPSVDDPGETLSLSLNPHQHFRVDRLPHGVSIFHFGTGHEWNITVPDLSGDRGSGRDARAAFAYEIDPSGIYGDLDRPMLKIVATPEATVTRQHHGLPRPRGRSYTVETKSLLQYWSVWEVRYLDQIVPQGLPIVPESDWKEIKTPRRVKSPEELAAELEGSTGLLVIDVAIGLIPVVGDAADISELVYGLITGEDRWGRPVSGTELAVMGLGAVLPFVSGSALRGGTRLIQRFGERATDAASLARRVKQAGLSRADVDAIERFEALVKAGRSVPMDLLSKATEVLRRVPTTPPSVEMFLNREATGFIHADLQEAYRRYVGSQRRQRRVPRPPAAWARTVTSGRPRALLEALLGPNYARRAVGETAPPINLVDVPRPFGYTDEMLERQRAVARSSGARLYERLSALVDEAADPGARALGLVRQRVLAGRFRIFKGNLAELFAEPLQRRELRRIAQTYPDAQLVSGVRVQLMQGNKLSPSKLFSDNLIVRQRQGRLEIRAVFEVKAGFRGGQEATEQIFEWIEGRLTEGSRLILHKGARMIRPNGSVRILKKDMTFTWFPGRADVPVVTGLANAERHLITARGSSLLGVDSAMGVPGTVRRHELEQSSAELDFLAAELLSGRETATAR
jgi:hypothetical protein